MLKHLLLFTALLLGIQLTVNAQSTKGVIKGKLIDSATKQPLSLATVTVFNAKDTTVITYRLSDPQGEFKMSGLPLEADCRAVITFSGYRVYRKEFRLTSAEPLDLGTIALPADASSLEEVIVTAERPPISVRKDTIEFNASSFKTLPTALVEDLLKKLPGMDLDKDGNMTFNGRKINRLLVDGKEFFGGDPKVATRNLPSNIVDKVQVTDDKDQLNQDPNIPKSELGQVVNLSLKKSIKKGWFGKAYAGGGTDDKYETGAILNLFKDTLQVSLLGYANNINKAGFGLGDIVSAGGFQRGGVSSLMIMSDGGSAINGISFGGTGQGIQKSQGGGININNEFGKKVTANLQYFYGHINSDVQRISNVQQFIGDTTITTRSVTKQNSDDYTHRIGGMVRWKVDTLTSILYRPSIDITVNRSERNLNTNTLSSYQPKLNESENLQSVRGNNFSYSHDLSYNRLFKKKGRSLYISNTTTFSNGDNKQYNDVDNIFYDGQSSYTLNQLRHRDQGGLTSRMYINYAEPITKKLSLRLSQTTEYFKSNDDLNTYGKDNATDRYNVPVDSLSNGLARSGWRNTTTASLRWTLMKELFVTPSVNFQWLNIDNDYTKNPAVKQSFFYVFPGIAINWKQLSVSYRASATEPSANDLQPVVDNTNPLYLQLGNPNLQPNIGHSFYVNYSKYDTKRNLNLNAYISIGISKDAVIRARTIDEKGVQTTVPINVDGTWNSYLNLNASKQFKFNKNWQLSIQAYANGGYSKSIILVNNNRSALETWNATPSARFSFNWKDIIEINERYSPNITSSKYENPAYTDLNVTTHYLSSELVVRRPKHWVWESTVDYTYNPQVAPGLRKSNVRWNAAVNFLFLKDDKGQLKFSVYDLLNQNVSISRTARENYIQDTQTTVLKRYFMLTFTYNIRNFGTGAKVGGRQSLFSF
ncbi:MAG: outer membrane beta-barrel protein [Chitinophagaceae bacterium]